MPKSRIDCLNDDYLIWWTDQDECEAAPEAGIERLPDYLRSEFRSRLGRPGRGRLWVAPHIPLGDGIGWDDNKPAARLAGKRAGIVIEAKDKPAVLALPGFLTDLKLNFIND